MSETQQVRDPFIRLLRRLRETNDPVTIIITSGENCCEHTGCIGEIVGDEYLTLITSAGSGGCVRTYIRIDCICAILDPADARRCRRRRRPCSEE
ncbi:hypothetical protein [Halonatronum saccharophilum]|uniref:hypothetical protein n=1 Tax=Halonatronum saccharophilum TaxID=150060 RepID=UPI000485CDFD|nr:hypothetical protein [Halonatronum saccharophilum]